MGNISIKNVKLFEESIMFFSYVGGKSRDNKYTGWGRFKSLFSPETKRDWRLLILVLCMAGSSITQGQQPILPDFHADPSGTGFLSK